MPPQFCEDWISSGRDEVKNCVIMCKGQKFDKNGGAIIRLGVPVLTWVEYKKNSTPEFGPIT